MLVNEMLTPWSPTEAASGNGVSDMNEVTDEEAFAAVSVTLPPFDILPR
jgi:hypothetical protein